MRVTPVNMFQTYKFENNQKNYFQYNRLRQDIFCPSFQAANRIYYSNGKSAITSLAGKGVTCLCCGKKMIDQGEINALEASGFFKSGTDKILKGLKRYEDYMRPLEKRIYKLLRQLHKQHPNLSIPKLLGLKKENLEKKLIEKQVRVFDKIMKYSIKHLPEEKIEQLNSIYENTYDTIYGRNTKETFSRKKFIGLMYKLTLDVEPKHKEKIIKMAETLPTSNNLYEAFVIKYSRKNNREIAMRLLQKSVGTVEHIKPRAEGGADSIENYALECAEDNWARGCNPMIQQIKNNPLMPRNAQKQVNQIIKLIKEGRSDLPVSYIKALKDALYRASGGVIDLNIKKLDY